MFPLHQCFFVVANAFLKFIFFRIAKRLPAHRKSQSIAQPNFRAQLPNPIHFALWQQRYPLSEATKDTAERGFERANCYSHPRATAAKERFLKKPFLDERDRVNENVALSSDASRMECLESVSVDVSHAESLEFVSVDVFHVEGLASAFHKAILWVLL